MAICIRSRTLGDTTSGELMKRDTVAFDTHASSATSRSVAAPGRTETDGAAGCSCRVGRAAFAISFALAIALEFSAAIITVASLGKRIGAAARSARRAYFDESFFAHFMM
jgi:hypothetical protein